MLEAVLATMGWAVSNHLIAGVEPRGQWQREPHIRPLRHVSGQGGF
jgi:hypothetical protein